MKFFSKCPYFKNIYPEKFLAAPLNFTEIQDITSFSSYKGFQFDKKWTPQFGHNGIGWF